MPSPFPGMDPYLEKPVLWPGFHHILISSLAAAISQRLPPRYVARIGERLYVVEEQRSIFPDLAMIERVPARPLAGVATRAVTAAPEEEDAPLIVDVEELPVRESFIEIRHVASEGKVVTVVEVLSPTNKSTGDDRDQYVRKQNAVLASPANLLEIDLLRKGRYTVAVPQGSLPTDVPWNYLVSLHRSTNRGRFEVWRIPLVARLPRIRVPLAEGEPDIRVDLQAVFTRAYEEGLYERDLDYTHDPVPALVPADAAWADALLRAAGLRT